jgi:hypothetical protein
MMINTLLTTKRINVLFMQWAATNNGGYFFTFSAVSLGKNIAKTALPFDVF